MTTRRLIVTPSAVAGGRLPTSGELMYDFRKSRGFASMAVILATVIASALTTGCGDDSGTNPPLPPPPLPPPESDLGDFPPGNYRSTIADAPPALEFLEGTWTLEIQPDGDFFANIGSDGVVGEVTVDGDRITFTDTGGSLACGAPGVSGTYEWEATATTVTFTPFSESCDGRRLVLGRLWNNQ